MGSRVELFEQIRMDHDRQGLSIRELARRHGVHRRTVRQALGSAVPPPRKRPEGRPAPRLGEYRGLIDSWLLADLEAPRKQRHTAWRVWERLRDEHDVEVSPRQVRRYVRARRRELGLPVDEVFVPLCHEPGAEAEVDYRRGAGHGKGPRTGLAAGRRRRRWHLSQRRSVHFRRHLLHYIHGGRVFLDRRALQVRHGSHGQGGVRRTAPNPDLPEVPLRRPEPRRDEVQALRRGHRQGRRLIEAR
jgi:transposase